MSSTSRATPVRPSSAAGKDVLNELLKDTASRTSQQYEITKLHDALKLKERTVDEQMKEISTLKISLAQAQRSLVKQQAEVKSQQEKAANALGGATAQGKELTMLKADKKKLEGQVAEILRQKERIADQLEKALEKNPAIAAQIANLQSAVRMAQRAADASMDEVKAVHNQLRSKDKELDRMQKLVDEAFNLVARNAELENKMRLLTKDLEDANTEMGIMRNVLRTREGDIARMTQELTDANNEIMAVNCAHADTASNLKAMTARCEDQEREMCRLRDELARTGAVAARVANSEVRAGSKDEGTVHMTQYLKEKEFWQKEFDRLKEKVAALEKQLSVADELKNRYRTTAERLSCGGNLPDFIPSPTGSGANTPRNIFRCNSTGPERGSILNGPAPTAKVRANINQHSARASYNGTSLSGVNNGLLDYWAQRGTLKAPDSPAEVSSKTPGKPPASARKSSAVSKSMVVRSSVTKAAATTTTKTPNSKKSGPVVDHAHGHGHPAAHHHSVEELEDALRRIKAHSNGGAASDSSPVKDTIATVEDVATSSEHTAVHAAAHE